VFWWHYTNQLYYASWVWHHIQHRFWLMLTASADPLTPNSPQGLGVANRCFARGRIFQEGNPAAGERLLYHEATNRVIFSTPKPQCILSLCLRAHLKPAGSLSWQHLLMYVLPSPWRYKSKQPDLSTRFLHCFHNQCCTAQNVSKIIQFLWTFTSGNYTATCLHRLG
jgi:hypothetical protein